MFRLFLYIFLSLSGMFIILYILHIIAFIPVLDSAFSVKPQCSWLQSKSMMDDNVNKYNPIEVLLKKTDNSKSQ